MRSCWKASFSKFLSTQELCELRNAKMIKENLEFFNFWWFEELWKISDRNRNQFKSDPKKMI